jgi:acetyl esterase/lipase
MTRISTIRPLSAAMILLTLFTGIGKYANAQEKEAKMVPPVQQEKVTLPLWEGTPPAMKIDDGFRPALTTCLLKTEVPLGAVIVVPGGGYAGRAEHEKWPIADFFNKAGLHAFVLDYRVSPHRHPEPLMDAQRAIRMVRQKAAEWKVKPDKIAILGFSAGGHLTASSGVFFEAGKSDSPDPVERVSSRPDALVLCYPVISSKDFGHRGSFENLLGKEASETELAKMSLEDQVRDDTPPTFLWSTANDTAVPVENSFQFARSLRKKEIPFEMHIYPDGPHGLGLAQADPHVATWTPLCVEWLRGMGW